MAITIKNNVMQQYKDALALDRQREQALFKAEQTMQAIDTPKAKVSDWQVAGETVADILGNVVVGAQKGLEGIYDFGATLVGAVGGIFDKDFQKDVQEHVAYNWTEDTTGKALREATQNSAVYNLSEKGQAVVRGVSQGVGQMLPTVAITAISGGAGLGVKAAQTVGMLSLGASAAGTSTEEAFNEGASYYGGAAYGVLNGILEMATEKLVGGAWDSVVGKGIADSAIKKVVSGATQNKVLQKGLKVLIDSAGEGAEEMVSEIVSPYLKRLTYDQQADTATVESVVEAGLIGALTSLAYGGAQTAVKKVAGVNTVIPSELENVANYDEALKKGWDSNDKAAVERVSQAKAETLKTISQELANMSEDKRAKYIEKHNLGGMFNADGTLTDTYNNAYNGNMELARAYDTRYVSMGADVNAINSDMQVLTDNMVKDYAQKNNVSIEQATAESKPIQVYQGELTDKAQKRVAKAKKFTSKMSEIGLSNLNLVVVDENPMFNGVVVNGKNIYVGKDTFENGNWTKTIIHEVLHTNEDTETYKILADTVRKIAEGKGILNARQQEILDRYQGSDQKTIDSELTALLTEELIGNEQFIDKVVAEQPNIAMRIVKKIQNLIKLFKMSGEKRAEYKVLTLAENMYLRSAYDHGRQNLIQIIEQGREDNKQVQVDEQNDEVGVDQTLALQYNKKRYAPRDISTVTEKEYYHHYWAIANDVINANNIRELEDIINNRENLKKLPKTPNGLYMVEVGEKGVKNKIIFTDAGINSYSIDKVIAINIDNETELSNTREDIYELESRGIQTKNSKLFKVDTCTNEQYSWESFKGRRDRKNAQDYYGDGNRGKNSKKAKTISFNDDGSQIVTYSDGTKETRWSLKDSQGKELSQQQAEYFRDSKVRDEQGNLLVVYHGSRNAGFTVFRTDLEGTYFTADKQYATEYAKMNNDNVYSVYLNIKKPFDTREKKAREIFEEQFFGQWGNGAPLTERGLLDWTDGADMYDFLQERGLDYDGIIVDEGAVPMPSGVKDRGISYVAFYPEQIKLTTNLNPTSDQDIRYSRKSPAPSEGDIIKAKGNLTTDKIFTKAEAKKIIAEIEERLVFVEKGMVGTVKGTNELIDQLWKGLNKANKGEYTRVGVEIADYVINHTVVEDIYEALSGDVEVEEARGVIKTLKQYFHKVKISDRVLGEIKHHFDDKAGKVLALWRAKEGGLAPDQIAQEIEKTGYITSDNESQIFIEMVEAYNKAVETVNRKSEIALNSVLDSEEIYQLRQNIISAVLDGKNAYGKDSTLTKLKEAVYKEQENYRTAAKKIYERNYAANHLLFKVQQIRDLKNHRFVNSATPKADSFKSVMSLLSKIKYAGNLNESGTRKIFKQLNEWYTSDNPMLGYVEGSNVGATLFDAQLKADIESIANGKERVRLTVEEIRLADKIMSRLYTLMVNDSRIFRAGRWVDAESKAQKYYEIDKANQEIKKSYRLAKLWNLVKKKFGNFWDMILDPASVVRRHDAYDENGFWTESYEEIRQAGKDQAIMEMNFKAPIEEFLEQHKDFLNETATREIDYRGQKIVVQNAMHLYMYFKRQLAQAGLVRNGFVVYDKDGNKTIYKGIKETTDLNEIEEIAKAQEQALYKQFTQAEKEYIKILEKIFNEDCKKAKEKTDIIRMGGSNVTDGYYVPITRYGAKQEELGNIVYDELDSLSNASFNKNTVQNSHMLDVRSIHDVCLKHIREVSKYATTQIPIDNYKKLYNIDLSKYINGTENVNSGMRLGDMLEWQTNGKRSGGHEYFNKLILDMVGIKPKPDAFNKTIGWIRGNVSVAVLALNPKVLATQVSSYIASAHILSVDSLARGAMLSGKDVDQYCNLAKLRNYDGTAYLAQTLTTEFTGKFAKLKEKPMTLIAKMDRFVIQRLFAASQVEIEKTQGLKLGSEENKIEAGKLLEKIILETQQNALMTERSALMRSSSELGKSFVMFTSDLMKNIGRIIDAFGKHFALKKRLANAKNATERATIEAEIKANNKQIVKSLVTMTALATYGSLVAMLFSHFFGTNDEDETPIEEFFGEFISTWVGGIPILKDIYNYFINGYDIEEFTLGSVNDVLGGISDFASGLENWEDTGETRQVLSGARKLAFSTANILGVPLKNLYKLNYGPIHLLSPSTAYKIDDTFYKQPYSKDLAKALEDDDEDMIATITELMLQNKSGGNFSDGSREEINRLVNELHYTSFMPKSIRQSFSFKKEEYTLTSKEFKQAKAEYKKANQKIDDLIAKSGYKTATDEEKAAMIKFIYDYYYEQTIVEAIGADKSKTLLFASGIKLEDMAIIVGKARVLEADKDRNGNTIAGSKKKKVVAMLQRQRLTADQKYLMLAYLGYSTDMERVERYVNRLRLTRDEKKALLEECA